MSIITHLSECLSSKIKQVRTVCEGVGNSSIISSMTVGLKVDTATIEINTEVP